MRIPIIIFLTLVSWVALLFILYLYLVYTMVSNGDSTEGSELILIIFAGPPATLALLVLIAIIYLKIEQKIKRSLGRDQTK